jgi:hypothetical protein
LDKQIVGMLSEYRWGLDLLYCSGAP